MSEGLAAGVPRSPFEGACALIEGESPAVPSESDSGNDSCLKSQENLFTEDAIEEENKRLEKEVAKQEKNMQKELLERYRKARGPTDMKDLEKKLEAILERSQAYAVFLTGKISKKSNQNSIDEQPSQSSSPEPEVVPRTRASKRRLLAIEAKATKKSKEEEPPQPSILENITLRSYQLEGLQWLKSLYANGVNGILADEMGLGKTIQIIALFAYFVENNVGGPYLVIVPLSTIATWLTEFSRFAPQLTLMLYHGRVEERRSMARSYKPFQRNGYEIYPIVLTTYEVPIRDQDFFLLQKWKYIVVDEGHRLKNYRCLLGQFLRSLQSENRLILTGTPLQNNLEELWSLLNFLMPEIFSDLNVFEQLFAALPMCDSALMLEQEEKSQLISKIHRILSPFILRRTKANLNIKLPPKKEVFVYASMSDTQLNMYEATLARDRSFFGGESSESSSDLILPANTKRRCTLGKKIYNFDEIDLEDFVKEEKEAKVDSKLARDEAGNLCKLFLTMQSPHAQLLKIASHPYLVRMPLEDGLNEILVSDELITISGKFVMLHALLKELKTRGHKVLIFSTFTTLLDLVEESLLMKNYRYVRLDGTVDLQTRCNRIVEFSTDPEVFIFLISTRAGGLGLNLTAADTVIILNSDWNPQADLQAQDRCYRLGQTKPVVVYRFITEGSIDEKVVQCADTKRKLERAILHKDKFKNMNDLMTSSTSSIPLEELKALLESKDRKTFRSDGVVDPEMLEELLDRSDMI